MYKTYIHFLATEFQLFSTLFLKCLVFTLVHKSPVTIKKTALIIAPSLKISLQFTADCRSRVENRYNVCQCQFVTCSRELHTKQQMSALWLHINCLFIVTVAENIKGLTLTAHLCKS